MEDMYQEALPAENKKFSIGRIAYLIIGIFAFILPFFFLPISNIPFQMSKGLLFATAVILALAFYIISVIKNAKLEIPFNPLFLFALVVPVVFILSAVVNGFNQVSVLGYSFELGTVSFLVLAFVFLFLTSILFQKKESVFLSILGFFVSALIIALFQIIRLFAGADFMSMGIFTTSSSNLIGNWNELAFFFGASAIVSAVTLELVTLSKPVKILTNILFIISLFFLLLVNSTLVWIITAIFALVFFIYLVSFDKLLVSKTSSENAEEQVSVEQAPRVRKISPYALIIIVLAIVIFVSKGAIGGWMVSKFGVSDIEVRPSWSSTMSITKASLDNSPLLGIGPNTFSREWLLNKPIDINSTVFWNFDFAYGVGLIPTFLVTTGALGGLAWIIFLILLLIVGLKAMFFSAKDPFSRFLIISSFLASAYLWTVSIFYVPTVTLFVLAYFFTGLLIASLLRESIIGKKVFSLHHPKVNFISVLVLIVALIGTISIGYLIVQKTVSFAYFQKGVNVATQGQNLDQAENLLKQAADLGGYDIYHRALAELYGLRLSNILSQENPSNPEALIAEAQQVLSASITSAQKATEIDPSNYQNWLTLGRIYASLVPPPFSVPGSYDSAKTAYEKALANNPQSPEIYLLLARLEVANGDLEASKIYAEKSAEKKDNYADAHFLLAQIAVQEGNLPKAITSLEKTLILSPNNPGLFFQLGVMKYSGRDYRGAAEAFILAIQLVPDYANAKYFLGLSLYQLGDTENAIKQFEDIEKTNPDNDEIKLILTNLQDGQAPFVGAEPPVTNKPEQREELPIEDNQ